jgi:hypothetical protein
MIVTFKFECQGAENEDDFKNYEISLEDISLPFQFFFIDTSKECGPRSNLNCVDFIWNYLVLLQFKKYALVAVPFDMAKILYLKHYRATSETWKANLMCESCFEGYKEILALFMGNCSLEVSCRCNLCLCQSPSLRGSASQAVFHVRYNIDQFELTAETIYDNYKYVANSKTVSLHQLVPVTFPTLHCSYIRNRNIQNKKIYESCVIESERIPVMWSTLELQHFNSLYDAVKTLSCDKLRDDWWCWFCTRPLFVPPRCILSRLE